MASLSEIKNFFGSRNIKLIKKERNKGLGRVYDFRAQGSNGVSTASIGNDECNIFFELQKVINAKNIFIVGHGFGLSSLAFHDRDTSQNIISIDNWSHNQQSELGEPLSKTLSEQYPDIRCVTGTSPDDVDDGLLSFDITEIDIAFIDGNHTDAAAKEDYLAISKYLTKHSLVLFHNANATQEAITGVYEAHGKSIFDSSEMLFSWGPTQIFWDNETFPEIGLFLEERALIWSNWRLNLSHINRSPSKRGLLSKLKEKLI